MRGRALSLVALIACGPTSPGEPDGSTAASSSTSTDASTTSTTAPTTGDPPPDLPVDPALACAAYCDAQPACGLPVTPECVEYCIDNLGHGAGNLKPGCVTADAALVACFATLDCEALGDQDSRYRACEPRLRSMLAACALCRTESSGWVDEGSCHIQELCPDGRERIECDADVCVCTFEGEVTEVCPSGGCDPEGFPSSGFQCCP